MHKINIKKLFFFYYYFIITKILNQNLIIFRLILDLEFFKIRNLTIAPFVALRIEQIRVFLQNKIINLSFSIKIMQLLFHNH